MYCLYLLLVFANFWWNDVSLLFLLLLGKVKNPAAPSSSGLSRIPQCIFLLYPHFTKIFGNDADSIFFTCFSVKKVYPIEYFIFDRYIPWYRICASGLVTPTVMIRSNFVFTVSNDTWNCFGSFISVGSFQCPKFLLASSTLFVLVLVSSPFNFPELLQGWQLLSWMGRHHC